MSLSTSSFPSHINSAGPLSLSNPVNAEEKHFEKTVKSSSIQNSEASCTYKGPTKHGFRIRISRDLENAQVRRGRYKPDMPSLHPDHQRVTFLMENGESFKVNGLLREGTQDRFDVLDQRTGAYLATLNRTTTEDGKVVWMTSRNTGLGGGAPNEHAAEKAEYEATVPLLNPGEDINALFKPLEKKKPHPLSFNVLKAELDNEWEKLTEEIPLSLRTLPTHLLKECLVPATPLALMGLCAYLTLNLVNSQRDRESESPPDQNLALIVASFSSMAIPAVYSAFDRIVDRAILSTNNPAIFKKLTHQQVASHIFKRFKERFEMHIKGLENEHQQNIRMTGLAVESMLQSDEPKLAELKIGLERYLIEIAFSAMKRVDVATYDGDTARQKKSEEELQRFLSIYPKATREGFMLLDQHVEDISKSKKLSRRNFFLQADKENAKAGGIGKSLAIKTYCAIKGKTFLKFSVSQKGLWHLTGMYADNARFDFSVEHSESLAPLVFEVMKSHDAAPIVYLEEAGETIANSNALNSDFNHAAMKEFSDTDIKTMQIPGWGNREIDISGWTVVAAGNIDVTDVDEQEIDKVPAAVSRRWTPIPFHPFGKTEKERVFHLTASTLLNAFKENGKIAQDILEKIENDLKTYRSFIIENDTHPGAPGVMRATDHAARYIRLGYQRGEPFTNIEIEQKILLALKQVEQVDAKKKETPPIFEKPGNKLGDGKQTLRTFDPSTPAPDVLREQLRQATESRLRDD
jgi:hypothetical protein